MAAFLDLFRLLHIVALVVALSGAALYGAYAFAARGHSTTVAPFVRARHDFPQALALASMIALVIGFGLDTAVATTQGPVDLSTGVGLSFAIGGITALVALAFGEAVLGPTASQLGNLGNQIGSNDPSPQQARQLRWLSTRLDRAERADLALLSVTIVCLLVTQLRPG